MIKILFICHGRDMPSMEKVLKIRDFLCFFCSFTKDLPILGRVGLAKATARIVIRNF